MSPNERREWVSRRDRERVRANERARHERHKNKRNALHREWTAQNPERAAEIKREWARRNPEKRSAHNALWRAIKKGELQPQPCEVCGAAEAEGHHEDYSKPLEVVWLCDAHHKARHVELREMAR